MQWICDCDPKEHDKKQLKTSKTKQKKQLIPAKNKMDLMFKFVAILSCEENHPEVAVLYTSFNYRNYSRSHAENNWKPKNKKMIFQIFQAHAMTD